MYLVNRNGGLKPSSLYSSAAERQSCKLKVLGSIPSGGFATLSVDRTHVENIAPRRETVHHHQQHHQQHHHEHHNLCLHVFVVQMRAL